MFELINRKNLEETFISPTGRLRHSKLKEYNTSAESVYNIYTYDYGICECGIKKNFISFKTGYNKFCSLKCSNNSNKTKELKKRKTRETLGVDYPSQSKKVKVAVKTAWNNKTKEELEDIESKRFNSCVDKYGQGNNIKAIRDTLDKRTSEDWAKSVKLGEETRLTTIGVKYPYQSNEIQHQQRLTKEKNKTWIPLEQVDNFKLYCRKVWKITNRQKLKSLKDFEKRGNGIYDMHLDHKISLKYGFENNIDFEIIGNITNLQMLPMSENCSKGSKSYSKLEQKEKIDELQKDIMCR